MLANALDAASRSATLMGSTNWTPTDITKLKDLWDQNLSARQIAWQFAGRFSRSAVCGKIGRLQLPERDVGHNCGSQIRGPRRKPLFTIAPKPKAAAIPLATEAPFPIGPIGNFPDSRSCRYIHGEVHGGQWLCCAAPGFPWCDFHAAQFNVKANSRAR